MNKLPRSKMTLYVILEIQNDWHNFLSHARQWAVDNLWCGNQPIFESGFHTYYEWYWAADVIFWKLVSAFRIIPHLQHANTTSIKTTSRLGQSANINLFENDSSPKMFEIISRSSLSLTAGLLLFRLILREQSLQAQTQIQSCHGEPNVKAQAHPLPNISSRCSTPCHLKPLVTTSSLRLNHTKITLNPGPRPTPSIPTPSSESFLGFLHIATACEAQRATDGHFDGWRRSRRLPRPLPRRRLGCHLVLAVEPLNARHILTCGNWWDISCI